jgi:hypothetical protein
MTSSRTDDIRNDNYATRMTSSPEPYGSHFAFAGKKNGTGGEKEAGLRRGL